MDLMCQTVFDFHEKSCLKVSVRLRPQYLHNVGVFFNTLRAADSKDTWRKISGETLISAN